MRAVNLIPLDQRGGSGPAAGRSEGGAYAVLVLVAGLALFALLYGTARHEISSRRAQAASLAVQTQRAQAMVAELAPYTSFLTLREQRVKAVSELAQSRFDWAHAFHELGRVLPHDASITSLTGTVGAAGGTTSSSSAPASSASVTSATPPGSVPTFTLGGCATSQSEVAQTLNRLRLIDGVSNVTLQSSTKPVASAGASAAAGGGGCTGNDTSFTVQVTYEPLPPVSETTVPAATPAANTGAAG